MLILGLETATRFTSVALVRGDGLLAEYTYSGPRRPSQVLLHMVDGLVRDTGVARRDLQGVAVGCGPGSFTGLRLGLATAQALSYALGIPVAGVGTLEAMAFPWLEIGGLVVPVLDAQRGRVYAAAFPGHAALPRDAAAWSGDAAPRPGDAGLPGGAAGGAGAGGSVPRTLEWEALLDQLNEWTRGNRADRVPEGAADRATGGAAGGNVVLARVVLVGEWAWQRRQEVASRLGDQAVVVEPHLGNPRAAVVAQLGRRALLAGSPGDPFALRAVYLRRSEAEELWERRRSGTSTGCM